MKDMINNFHLGKSTRREEIQQRMRNLQNNGSVIQECYDALESMTPATKLEATTAFNKERKWQVIQTEKSAPYVGERY